MRDPNLHHHHSLDDLDLSTKQSLELSALTDGELSEDEWENLAQVLATHAQADTDDTLAATWHRYHLIGEVMRSAVVQAGDVEAQASIRFAQGVMAKLTQSPEPAASELVPPSSSPPSLRPMPIQAPVSGAPAANDEWFRWRGLAMMASLALVGIVAWRLMPSDATPNAPVALPLHRLSQSPQSPAPVDVSNTLAVETTQGVVIRDARLEAWMQTHRQHGAASALQAPAGFLRAATLDVPKP